MSVFYYKFITATAASSAYAPQIRKIFKYIGFDFMENSEERLFFHVVKNDRLIEACESTNQYPRSNRIHPDTQDLVDEQRLVSLINAIFPGTKITVSYTWSTSVDEGSCGCSDCYDPADMTIKTDEHMTDRQLNQEASISYKRHLLLTEPDDYSVETLLYYSYLDGNTVLAAKLLEIENRLRSGKKFFSCDPDLDYEKRFDIVRTGKVPDYYWEDHSARRLVRILMVSMDYKLEGACKFCQAIATEPQRCKNCLRKHQTDFSKLEY